MTDDINKIIKSKDWQFYLSRPFTVFGASVWQSWYNSEEAKIVLGITSPDVLFLEEEKNVARCYQPREQLTRLNDSVRQVIYDKKRAIKLMKEGLDLNQRAIKILAKKNQFSSTVDAFRFLTAISLRSTVLPNRVGQFLASPNPPDGEVVKLTKKLRAISYYPRLIEEVIMPMVRQELKLSGVSDPEKVSEIITFNEYRAGKFKVPKSRLAILQADKFYLLTEIDKKQDVNIVPDSLSLIRALEPNLNFNEIKGSAAYLGKITGRVKLVSVRSAKEVKLRKGEILVSVSTSPIYLSLMKKAGAIVTDEGGLTSHAAILARELKKPTIIGTRIATKVLKDGDLVEVDANKGIVRKLK